MKQLLLILLLSVIDYGSIAQINFTTWQEDIRHKSDVYSDIPYDSTIIVNGTKQAFSIDPKEIQIEIDYCSRRITTNYYKNDEVIETEYTFDKCGLESWKLDKKIYFNQTDDNKQFYRHIEYYKTQNRLQIIEEKEKKTRTVIQFYGKELTLKESGLECKLFYDQPYDTTLYKVDLSLLEGTWVEQNTSHKLEISLSEKAAINSLFSICNVSERSKGISGEIHLYSDQSSPEHFIFYACVSENYEIRIQLEFDGIADDAYIRRLTENELILDYTSHYMVLRRKE